MRTKPIAAALLVLALSIISTTFVLLALTSKQWARQDVLSTNTSELGIQDVVVCTALRSPFYRCGYPKVDENATCAIPDCHFYKPYGNNQTSCRSQTQFGNRSDDIVGAGGVLAGSQECQNGRIWNERSQQESALLTPDSSLRRKPPNRRVFLPHTRTHTHLHLGACHSISWRIFQYV